MIPSARTPLIAILSAALLPAFSAAQPPQTETTTQPAPRADDAALNALSKAEVAAGWRLLFDGRTTEGWRGYRKPTFPQRGWTVEDGQLKCLAKGGGGDILTVEQFADFELSLDWAVSPGANSGIIFRAVEKHDAAWQTGPEFQILDDAAHPQIPRIQSAGALYDLYEPAPDKVLEPAGAFNRARIRVKDGVIQHFLNGVKLVECRMDDDEWRRRVAASKFARYEGFGAQPRGHIALQDHGNAVAFRNLKVRDLAAPLPREVTLFNGRDLEGWVAHLPEGAQASDVWRVEDGVLICTGNPAGYIRTQADFTNYVLKLEWRFNPVTKRAGNSGVLLRVIGPDKVWPRSVEAQLQSGNAGDFWNIDEFPMRTAPERTSGRNTRKTHAAERPIGEWNEYEIIVCGGQVVLIVNGEELNRAWDVLETPGKIALQSEGAEIHFRNIRLAPID